MGELSWLRTARRLCPRMELILTSIRKGLQLSLIRAIARGAVAQAFGARCAGTAESGCDASLRVQLCALGSRGVSLLDE